MDFYGQTREMVAETLAQEFGLRSYRAIQLFQWIYKRGVRDFAEMSDLGRELRSRLSELYSFPEAIIRDRQVSVDGSRKYLIEVREGICVEAVMIKQPTRMTLCVSSQYGCGMGCTFCRTATMGFQGNLTAGDIVRQVLAVRQDAEQFGDMFHNIVFMGMGEPLHNYRGVVDALKILTDDHAFALGGRKITVSSVGLVPAIERFGKEGLGVNLAVSLNATTDAVRSEIMPINRRFPLERLLRCLQEFPLPRRKRITIEYVMLAGVNDSDADARRLVKLLHGIRCKVNLIPYNENAGLGYRSPDRSRVQRWLDLLVSNGLDTTIRWSKGQDIDAACGQLVIGQKEHGSVRKTAPDAPEYVQLV